MVHILTSKDREGEVGKLKEQSDIIEKVVDAVVHNYHSGFNKAIQNYSQVYSYTDDGSQYLLSVLSILKILPDIEGYLLHPSSMQSCR